MVSLDFHITEFLLTCEKHGDAKVFAPFHHERSSRKNAVSCCSLELQSCKHVQTSCFRVILYSFLSIKSDFEGWIDVLYEIVWPNNFLKLPPRDVVESRNASDSSRGAALTHHHHHLAYGRKQEGDSFDPERRCLKKYGVSSTNLLLISFWNSNSLLYRFGFVFWGFFYMLSVLYINCEMISLD